jgi:hypothetical protein
MVRCTKRSSGIWDHCKNYDTDLYCFKCNNCDYCNCCYHQNWFLEDNNNKMYYLECDTAWTRICYAQCHPSVL